MLSLGYEMIESEWILSKMSRFALQLDLKSADIFQQRGELKMNERNVNLIWVISLILVAVTSFLLAGDELFDFNLPDSVIRILGIIDLISLPVLIFSTIQKNK